MTSPTTGIRLQKYLAECGIASRRKSEEVIQSGRVRVNGAVVKELGTRVVPGKDLVVVDGVPVEPNEERRYILLYKPPGCVTTLSDPQGRPTARGYLAGVEERVFPVGRLDYDAEGALLFTDDGELANRLAHPRYGHKRVYLVKTKGTPPEAALRRMVEGVRLEDGPAQALSAEVHEQTEKNTWIKVVVGEGRFHLVKRLCEAVSLPVLRLFRPEFGGVTVQRLRPGHWRNLTGEEVQAMREAVGLTGGVPHRTAMAQDLPKAGRRHGHGPPPQRAPEDRTGEHPGQRGQPEARRSGRDTERGGRASAGQGARGRARDRGSERATDRATDRGGDRGGERGGERQARRGERPPGRSDKRSGAGGFARSGGRTEAPRGGSTGRRGEGTARAKPPGRRGSPARGGRAR